MISCIVKSCHWTASSHDLLYWHLHRMHAGLINYKCNINNCYRSFSICTMFQRHYNKHFTTHCILDNNREISQNTEQNDTSHIEADNHLQLTRNEAECSCKDIKEKKFQTMDVAECSYNNIKEKQPQTVDIESLSKGIKAMSLNFTLKWLSTDSLPRKIAFQIQQDVKSHILQPISHAIQLLSSAGQITEELKLILFDLLSVFDQESEFKCIQKLKENQLFEEPEIFTISNELRPGVSRNTQQMVCYCLIYKIVMLVILSIY